MWRNGRLDPVVAGEWKKVGMCTVHREKYVLRFSKMKRDRDSCGQSGVGITHENILIRLRPVHLQSHMHHAIQSAQVSSRIPPLGNVPPARSTSGSSASSNLGASLDTSLGGDMDVGVNMGKLRWQPDVEDPPHQRSTAFGASRASREKERPPPHQPRRYSAPELSTGTVERETSTPLVGNWGRLSSRSYFASMWRDKSPKLTDMSFRSTRLGLGQMGDLRPLLHSSPKRPRGRAIDELPTY